MCIQRIKRHELIVESAFEPENKHVLWLDTSENPPCLKVYIGLEWIPISSASSNTSIPLRIWDDQESEFEGTIPYISYKDPYFGLLIVNEENYDSLYYIFQDDNGPTIYSITDNTLKFYSAESVNDSSLYLSMHGEGVISANLLVLSESSPSVKNITYDEYRNEYQYSSLSYENINGPFEKGAGFNSAVQKGTRESEFSEASGAFSIAGNKLSHAIAFNASAFGKSTASADSAFSANEGIAGAASSAAFNKGITGNKKYSFAINEGTATGEDSFASGKGTTASGAKAFALGLNTTASGANSFTRGKDTVASGDQSVAEGEFSRAYGARAIASGYNVAAAGAASTAFGKGQKTLLQFLISGEAKATTFTTDIDHNLSVGDIIEVDLETTNPIRRVVEVPDSTTIVLDSKLSNSVIDEASVYKLAGVSYGPTSSMVGDKCNAVGERSYASGFYTVASGQNSHTEGNGTVAQGSCSHAEGSSTKANSDYSHAEGYLTKAEGAASHAEGTKYNNIDTAAMADAAHAEGAGVVVKGQAAHGEGLLNVAGRTQEEAVAALADFPNLGGTTEQKISKLIGFASHSEGSSTQALGTSSHAEGNSTQALVNATHAEGDSTTASGEAAHSEGYITTASGNQAHAEGYKTTASGNQAHAEGKNTEASSGNSHAEGKYTKATSENAHAEGNHTTANGNASHTEGYYTVADNDVEHAEGKYNVSHTGSTNAEKTIHSVGIGSYSRRENAFEIMQNGDAYLKGVGNYDGTNPTAATPINQLIGSGGSSEVFWATYGRTRFEEIAVAISAGKLVVLKILDGEQVAVISDQDLGDDYYRFTCIADSLLYVFTVDQFSSWSTSNEHLLPGFYSGSYNPTLGTWTISHAIEEVIISSLKDNRVVYLKDITGGRTTIEMVVFYREETDELLTATGHVINVI